MENSYTKQNVNGTKQKNLCKMEEEEVEQKKTQCGKL
jgi:hypothetical protein